MTESVASWMRIPALPWSIFMQVKRAAQRTRSLTLQGAGMHSVVALGGFSFRGALAHHGARTPGLPQQLAARIASVRSDSCGVARGYCSLPPPDSHQRPLPCGHWWHDPRHTYVTSPPAPEAGR